MFTSFEKIYIQDFKDKIAEFGGVNNRIRNGKKERYVWRENTKPDKNGNTGAFFGCIKEGEEESGVYYDLSIVVCVSNEQNAADDRWIIGLVVGSLGYKDDYNIASLPGTRRLFYKYLSDPKSYIKTNFLDIESDQGFKSFLKNLDISDRPDSLEQAVDKYPRVLLTATLVNPNNEKDTKETIYKYLALYSMLRSWTADSKSAKTAVDKLLSTVSLKKIDDEKTVKNLIEKRKYVVLQGAPGTGKTRLAKIIAEEAKAEVFFTQFHAETTKSEFIYGIVPGLNSETLKYEPHKGIFAEAIDKACTLESSGKAVYLIIDEINRANLSNVLGPCFYLFEPTMTSNNVEIEIYPGKKLKELPKNLYVIATMNTADRSLAVVDFALRRRFAWYTLLPHEINTDNDKKYHFCKEEFTEISNIFERYATDEELNLQPGHAYFLVSKNNKDEEIENRLRYEIMPLIKEYLLDGMLSLAKDAFVSYFRNRIGEEMFK